MLPLFSCRQFIFCVAQSFVGLSLNCPQQIIKRIAIRRFRGSDIWGDVVAEIFSQPHMFLVLRWHNTYSYCYPLGPLQHYLLQSLDEGLCVESDAVWEDEWRNNVNIDSDHTKHDVDWVFGLHRYILWDESRPMVVLWLHHLISA